MPTGLQGADGGEVGQGVMLRGLRANRCQHYECVLIYSKFEDSGIPENYDVERLSSR